MLPDQEVVRSFMSRLIHRYHWLPLATILVFGAMFIAAEARRASPLILLVLGAPLSFAFYFWGYSTRAHRVSTYPALLNLPRRRYGEVWDALAASPARARAAACGHAEEDDVRASAQVPLNNLIELVGVRPQDDVLEFGCGVARIGLELALRCHTWAGVDLSTNMLTVAAQRLRGRDNVRLIKLREIGLDGLVDSCFDLVYSTNVFDHLDEMDRWRYVKDSFRVLRYGGRLYIDNVDLESEEGWVAFSRGAEVSQVLERPPYTPTPSTAAELTTYAIRAGFQHVLAHKRPPLVIVTAVKP